MVVTAISRQRIVSDHDGSIMSKRSKQTLENEIFERQVLICKAFANSTRLRMLDLLGRHDWSAADLQKALGVSKANLSQHVMVLKSAGVIVRRREGREVFFSLAMPEVKKACQLIQHVLRAQIRNGQRLAV
ncbi:MAG: metalloregulator ArsR/SmtB family transcription factor [Terriglobales bacterium]